MSWLALGVALFVGVHLIPSIPGLRLTLVSKLGDKGYQGLYSLLSFAGFGLLIWGKGQAAYLPAFEPPSWGRSATFVLMVPFSLSLTATFVKTNLKRLTPHPLLWSTVIWGGAHLLSNGDWASILLFGGFLVFGAFLIRSLNRRGKFEKGQPVPWSREMGTAALAVLIYVGLLYVHPFATGASVLL